MMFNTRQSSFRMALVLLLIQLAGPAHAAENDLEALRQLMGPILGVKLEAKTSKTEPKETVPPLQNDEWNYSSGASVMTIRYSRYLNQPPHYTGSYPSLANGDMGVGFNGGPFQFWYGLRVLLDDKDILQAKPANRCEAVGGEYGHLRLVWELEAGGKLTLNFTVPEGGDGIYARIDLEPATPGPTRIQVQLTCYPGGFGPAHNMPSHRFAKSASTAADVPADFKVTPENPYPVLPLAKSDEWVFYGDRKSSIGTLGLLLNPAEEPTSQVSLSNYGVITRLTYPAVMRRIHLGFFAFSLENEAAEKAFSAGLDTRRQTLRSIPFGP